MAERHPDDSRAAAPDVDDDADGEPEGFARAITQAEFGADYDGPRCVLGRLAVLVGSCE